MEVDNPLGDGVGPLRIPPNNAIRGQSTADSSVRDEVTLLRDAASGRHEAGRVLMDEHMPTVYGFVRGRLGGRQQPVDDIVQETLVEAIRSAHSFRGESSLATWLCAIARRRLARFYESERRHEEAGLWLAPTPTNPQEAIDQRDEVVRVLGSLSPTHRQVLVMKYLDGSSVEQIAEQLGKSSMQIQSLLQRARENFKTSLDHARR